MVNYNLCVVRELGSKELDLSKLLNNKNLRRLDGIDEFTMSFKNEESLKQYLLLNGYIDLKDMNAKLNITYKYNDRITKLPVVYSDFKKYLDVDYLKSEIAFLYTNVEFLTQLLKLYDNKNIKYNKQGQNILDIKFYIREKNQNTEPDIEILVNEAVYDLFKKTAFTYDNKRREHNKNYKGLREFAHFLYRYECKEKLVLAKQKIMECDAIEDEVIFEPLESRKINYNLLTAEFNDGEPLFAPNSDDERMYNEYMEKLSNDDLEFSESNEKGRTK